MFPDVLWVWLNKLKGMNDVNAVSTHSCKHYIFSPWV